MIILAFDTSVNGCAVCVADGSSTWVETVSTERGQAEMLVPMIDEVLGKSGYAYSEIERIGITVGPGSFTGLRVGLSTAKALALSLNKPLIGFTTFEIIAAATDLKTETLLLIDTKRGDFYGQIFHTNGKHLSDPRIWTLEETTVNEIETIRDVNPDVKTLAAKTAAFATNEKSYDPLKAPQPLYLRGAEVSQSKRKIPTIV